MADLQHYDAFISYRHLPLDRAVAERVQKLLENYKAPFKTDNGKKAKIGRIFRDQAELPTSGDLDNALQRALESSEFLIVVLSRQTKESKWCMEEIKSFKKAHSGRISHILPILVDGEPSESIPDILRYETREIVNEDGTVELQEVEVEPLCCDVRSDSVKGSLKKLNTEFLRLCAPMLGVGFDDLYQRHARRRRQVAVVTTAVTVALLAVILSIISFFAYQTYQAQQQYQRNLVDKGASQITAGDYEQALMYYSEALSLNNNTQAAKTGALLLLQQHGWLNHVSDGSGWITGEILYDNTLQALAVDTTGEKLLREDTNGTYITDKTGTTPKDLSTYGEFISGAQDGSCWTFATDDTITFYFTADSSIAQVERPKEINPSCDHEWVEFYTQDNDNWLLSAMAPNRTRAVVCYGGYLYVYDLNETNIRGTLYETFDLSLVFEEVAKRGIMTVAFEMWVDAGGNLCVISDLNSAAVFNITNKKFPCLNSFHEVYGRTLQNVAFSADGQYYALVYGNDIGIYNNPGGCIEVYDQFGNACMATDFDGNTPLLGTTFEPDGSRIAAWGSGELCIWDWSTGAVAAAPLKTTGISSAVWLEDGRLAVSEGNGAIRYYTIVQYEANDVSIELEKFKKQDYQQSEYELSTGYHIMHDAISISITDSRGATIDECRIVDLNTKTTLVNRMFVDDKHSTAYLWNYIDNTILEVMIENNGKLSLVSEMDTRGMKAVALYPAWNGVLAEMETGELFYYENGSSEIADILKPQTPGSITNLASNESGLVCFVIRNQRYINARDYEYTYSAELWDLNKGVMLAELEKDSQEEITSLTFSSNDYLAFARGNEIITWLLDAPSPNRETVEILQNMSCYRLSEANYAKVVDVAFDAFTLGIWNSYFHIASKEIQEPAMTFTQEIADILEQQGEEAWINAYNEWWNSKEPESIVLSELCDIMDDFFATARTLGRENDLRGALERFVSIASSGEEPDLATAYKIDFIIYDIIFYTPKYVDLAVKYYDQTAAMYERIYESGAGDEYIIYAFSSRICSGILQGRGMGAFEIGNDIMDGIYSMNMPLELQVYAYLLSGRPEAAALAFNELTDDNFKKYGESAYTYIYWPLLLEISGYVKVGAISEADYSDFVGSLKYPTGIRIAQVTSEQLEAGLRLGDVVVAVNGIHFGTPQYLSTLKETNPTASFTVIRGESAFTIEGLDDWQLAGGFPTKL